MVNDAKAQNLFAVAMEVSLADDSCFYAEIIMKF